MGTCPSARLSWAGRRVRPLAHQLTVSAAGALGASIAPIAALAVNDELLLRGRDPEEPRDLAPKLAHRHVRRRQRDPLRLRCHESGDLNRTEIV